MTETGWKKQIFLAMASGIILLLSASETAYFSLMAWFGLTPLLFAVRNATLKRAFCLGLLSGIIFFTGLLYWILIVLGYYGHLPLWTTLPALLLLSAYMGLYTGLFATGIAWLNNRFLQFLGAPILWVSLDYIRGKLFSGFPWYDLGYTQSGNKLILQAADIFGHHGITFLIVVVNCAILYGLSLLSSRREPHSSGEHAVFLAVPAFLLCGAMGYGILRFDTITQYMQESAQKAVTVVQGNVAQDQKWLPSFQEKTLAAYLDLSLAALDKNPASLLVWPETAMPFYPLEHSQFKETIRKLVIARQVSLITGAPHRQLQGFSHSLEYFNSAFLISSDMSSPTGYRFNGRYDKQHLVPFGEYIPLRKILPLPGPLVETIGDFSTGSTGTPLTCKTASLGVFICFESIFPDIAREEVMHGANMLVNLTNDAWFGRSSAPWQHLSMVIFRAVENRRSLARSANTGFSGFIEPTGKTRALSPLYEKYTATEDLPLLEIQTFFTKFGYQFPRGCLVLIIPLTLLRARLKKQHHFTRT